jgi:hypothetical protein
LDDFESGTLQGWSVGDDRSGNNEAVVAEDDGSLAARVHQANYGSIRLYRSFEFDPLLVLMFDMKLDVRSSTLINYNSAYMMAGAKFTFRDSTGQSLGSVEYVRSTSGYPFVDRVPGSSESVNEVWREGWQRYAFDVSELLDQISIDAGAIASVEVSFNSIGATSFESPSATTWFDNVFVFAADPGASTLSVSDGACDGSGCTSAPPVPLCGLLGIEALLGLIPHYLLRFRRTA